MPDTIICIRGKRIKELNNKKTNCKNWVENTCENAEKEFKKMEEDAMTILTSLVKIAESNRTSIDKDFKPYVTWTDAPDSLPESLLKQATTLPYGEDEKNVEV